MRYGRQQEGSREQLIPFNLTYLFSNGNYLRRDNSVNINTDSEKIYEE